MTFFWRTYALMPSFVTQMEPLQLSFSVAALLGEKFSDQSARSRRKDEEDAGSHPALPPTPQPSDSEEDEPPRKRRCVEQCELAKVIKRIVLSTDSCISHSFFFLGFPSIYRFVLIDWNGELELLRHDSERAPFHSFHLFNLRVDVPSIDNFQKCWLL